MKIKLKDLWSKIIESDLYKSVFRVGVPDDHKKQLKAMHSSFTLHILGARIKKEALKLRHTWCMGGITLLLFIIETITGLVLMFYYRPTVEAAYMDMKELEFSVPFGMFLRNLHRWGAHAMVITICLHMFRVFMTGSYKPPRQFNWVVGVGLMFCTLMLSFTGYLLPWDQLSFWAITVGTNMARGTPFVGHEGPFASLLGMTPLNDVRALLLGGQFVGGDALLRFYVMHCVGLPLIITLLMVVHFWRVRKDGISGPL